MLREVLHWRYTFRWPTLRESWFMQLMNGLSVYPAVVIVFTIRIIVCFRVATRGVVTRVCSRLGGGGRAIGLER